MNIPSDIQSLRKCCERGHNCCVGLGRANIPLIYKGEELTRRILGEQKKACDCFIFDDTHAVLVELKSRTLDYSAIKEKFDNGVEVVNTLLNAQATDYKIIPVLLVKAFNKKPSNNPRTRRLSIKIKSPSPLFMASAGCSWPTSWPKYDTAASSAEMRGSKTWNGPQRYLPVGHTLSS